MNESRVFSLGRLDVDVIARRITVDGAELRAEPKVFDLLVFLARHPGRVISQDEILKEVWGRPIASDAVVSQAVHKLRVILREHGGLPEALVTLRGVGYRLDVPDKRNTHRGVASRRPPWSDWRLTLPLVVLIVGLVVWWQVWETARQVGPRIAILELENATGRSDLDWVRAGGTALMSEELLRRGIDVVSSDEIERMAGESSADHDPIAAAGTLGGVDEVFAPRLLPDEDGFRIELVSLTDQSRKNLELTGTGPATLSLAMAAMLADKLSAPLRPPAGALGLGNPFLDEAYARAYHHKLSGEFRDARELYDYILREAPNAHWARYHLSITLRMAGDMEAAREHLEALFEVELEDAWLTAAIRSTMGNMEWYAGNLDLAEAYYRDARNRFAEHQLIGGVASTLGNLGMVAFSRADFGKGREFARQALEIYRRQGNQVQTARLLHNIGYSHYDEGNFEDALHFLEQSYGMRVNLGLRDQAANTRTIIAEIAIEQGRIDEGVKLLDQSRITFAETGNDRGLSRTLADLARVANRRGKYRRAQEWAMESLTMARSRNEAASIGQAALILGRSLHADGDYFGAEDYYRQAASVWMKLDNTPGQITCLAEEVRLALDRDDPVRAGELLVDLEQLTLDVDDERYIDTLKVLQLRLRITTGDLTGIEPDMDAVLADFDHQRLDHAELIIELAEALHMAHADHPLLARLKPSAEQWAKRYFPAARHLYQAASDPEDCRAASRAMEQLQGPDWRKSLPPSPVCKTG